MPNSQLKNTVNLHPEIFRNAHAQKQRKQHGEFAQHKVTVLAIYQIMLPWKQYQYQYYYETVEFPNPRPTQPKKK